MDNLEKEYNITTLKRRENELEIKELEKNPIIQKYFKLLDRDDLLRSKEEMLKEKLKDENEKKMK